MKISSNDLQAQQKHHEKKTGKERIKTKHTVLLDQEQKTHKTFQLQF